MTDTLTVGQQLLVLLDESARTSTYKPALLLALIDGAQEHGDDIPVESLAKRVIELYWPQTRPFEAGDVLRQNQRGQATIVRDVAEFRGASTTRMLSVGLREGEAWQQLVAKVELTLAEWPIPRLQRPLEPFLYDFGWSWADEGGWSKRGYLEGTRSLRLHPGVPEAMVNLGPLLRPFIVRWWIDKAAQLNPGVKAAESLIAFEDFMFGKDRRAVSRVAEGLLDFQGGACFYCRRSVGTRREVDHFVPWSYSGDDGIDNLVVACPACNNEKRALLPGPTHLAGIRGRNRTYAADLAALARERAWPRDRHRTGRLMANAYLHGSGARRVWTRGRVESRVALLDTLRPEIEKILAT